MGLFGPLIRVYGLLSFDLEFYYGLVYLMCFLLQLLLWVLDSGLWRSSIGSDNLLEVFCPVEFFLRISGSVLWLGYLFWSEFSASDLWSVPSLVPKGFGIAVYFSYKNLEHVCSIFPLSFYFFLVVFFPYTLQAFPCSSMFTRTQALCLSILMESKFEVDSSPKPQILEHWEGKRSN